MAKKELLSIKLYIEQGSAPMRVSHTSFNPEFYFKSSYLVRFILKDTTDLVMVDLKR